MRFLRTAWGRRLLLGLISALAFSLSFRWTFPGDALLQRVQHEMRKQTRGLWQVNAEDITLSGLLGLRLEKVKISRMGRDKRDVALDALELHVGPFTFLGRSKSGQIHVEQGDGSMDVHARGGGPTGEWTFETDMDEMPLAWLSGLMPESSKIPLGGTLTGEIQGHLGGAQGEITGKAKIAALQVGPGIVTGLTVPPLGFGQLDLTVATSGGETTFNIGSAEGADVALSLDASSRLQNDWKRSSLRGCMQVLPSEATLQKNETMRSAWEIASIRFRKDDKGRLSIPLQGMVGAPNIGVGVCSR